MHVPLRSAHRALILDLLRRTPEFRPEDVDVAVELVDDALGGGTDYRFVVDEGDGDALLGYACFGATPMTDGTFDLYWIAVEPAAKRSGVGRRLLERVGYETLATIRDFYAIGRDLVVFGRYL